MDDDEREAILTMMRSLDVGEEVTFRGARSNPYRLTVYRYDYEASPIRCAACSTGSGMPWAGWFACEDCPAISFIATSQVFLPAMRTAQQAVAPGWSTPDRDPYDGCGFAPTAKNEAPLERRLNAKAPPAGDR